MKSSKHFVVLSQENSVNFLPPINKNSSITI